MKSNKRKINFFKGAMLCLAFASCTLTGGMLSLIENTTKANNSDGASGTIELSTGRQAKSDATIHVSVLKDGEDFVDSNGHTLYFHESYGVLYTNGSSFFTNFVDGEYRNPVSVTGATELSEYKLNASASLSTVVGQINNGETFMVSDLEHDGSLANNLVYTNEAAIGELAAESKIFSDGSHYFYFKNDSTTKLMPIFKAFSNEIDHFEIYSSNSDIIRDDNDNSNDVSVDDVEKIYINSDFKYVLENSTKSLSSKVGVQGTFIDNTLYTTDTLSNKLIKEPTYIYGTTKVNRISDNNKLQGYRVEDKYYRVYDSVTDAWYYDGTSTKQIASGTYYFARESLTGDFVSVNLVSENIQNFAVIDGNYIQQLTQDVNWNYNLGSAEAPNWVSLTHVSGNTYSYGETKIVINPNAETNKYFIDNNNTETFDEGDVIVDDNALSNYYFEDNLSTRIYVGQDSVIPASYVDPETSKQYIERASFSQTFNSKIQTTVDHLKTGYSDNNFLEVRDGNNIELYFNKEIFVEGYALTNNYTIKYYTNSDGNIGVLQNANYSSNFEYYYVDNGIDYVAPGAIYYDYYFKNENAYFGVANSNVINLEFYYEEDGNKHYVLQNEVTFSRKEGYNSPNISENGAATETNYTLRISVGEFGTSTNKIVDPSNINYEVYHNGTRVENETSLDGDSANGYYLSYSAVGVNNMIGTWEVYVGGTKTSGATNNGYLVNGKRYFTSLSFSIIKESDYFVENITPKLHQAEEIDATIKVKNYYNAQYIDENNLPYVLFNTNRFSLNVNFKPIDSDQITTYSISRINESTIRIIKSGVSNYISLDDSSTAAESFKFYFTELGNYEVSYSPIVKLTTNYSALSASNLFRWTNVSGFDLTNMGYQLLYTNYANSEVKANFFRYSNVLTLDDYFTNNYSQRANGASDFTSTRTLATACAETGEVANLSSATAATLNGLFAGNVISTNQPPISFNFSGLLTTISGSTNTNSFYWFKSNSSDTWVKTENLKVNDRFVNPGKYVVYIEFNPTKAVGETTLKQYFAFEISNSQSEYSLKDSENTIIENGHYTNNSVTLELTAGSEFDIKPEITVWFTNLNYEGKTQYNGTNLSSAELEKVSDTKYIFKSSRKWFVKLFFGPSIVTNSLPSDKTNIDWSFTIDSNPIVYTPYQFDNANSTYFALADEDEIIGGQNAKFMLEFGDYFANNVAKKKSGAYVYATYTFTPIETRLSSLTNEDRKIVENDKIYLQTDYILNFAKTTNATQYNYGTSKSAQGLYEFTIIDQAGNESSYYIFIDSVAPAYYVDDNTIASAPSTTTPYYEVVWGDFKAIEATGTYTAPSKKSQDGQNTLSSSLVKSIASKNMLVNAIARKNMNFYSDNPNENSIYNRTSDLTKAFETDEKTMQVGYETYLSLTKTGFRVLETKRNEGKFVVYVTDSLSNKGASNMVTFNFDISQTTTYVKNDGTTAADYLNSVYPDLVNNTASNLDYLFITSETSGTTAAGDWEIEYIKVDFYPVDFSNLTSQVYASTPETKYIYNRLSNIDQLSNLSTDEIVALFLNSNAKTGDGKFVITRKYGDGFTSPPDFYEAKTDINGKAIYTSGYYYFNGTESILVQTSGSNKLYYIDTNGNGIIDVETDARIDDGLIKYESGYYKFNIGTAASPNWVNLTNYASNKYSFAGTNLYDSSETQVTNSTLKSNLLAMLKATGATKVIAGTRYFVYEALYYFSTEEQEYYYVKNNGTTVYENDASYVPYVSKKGIETDDVLKTWDVFIDRIKPIQQINSSVKIGEQNKLILQPNGENLEFNEFSPDETTLSLDTNLLPIAFSILSNKYASTYQFFTLSGVLNGEELTRAQLITKVITSGDYTLTLKDNVNQTVFDSNNQMINQNSFSLVFKATQRNPQARFEISYASSTEPETLVFEDKTDFISVKKSETNTVQFVIEDPADFFQAKVNPNEIYLLTNNQTWTKVNNVISSIHENNTYSKYDPTPTITSDNAKYTRYTHTISVDINEDGVYGFKIQFNGNETDYVIDENNFYYGYYTIVVDSILPTSNVLSLVEEDEFYLDETSFDASTLSSQRSLATYEFNANANLTFNKYETDESQNSNGSQEPKTNDDVLKEIYGDEVGNQKVALLDTYKIFIREVRLEEFGFPLSLPSVFIGDENYGDTSINSRFSGIKGGYYFELEYGKTIGEQLAEIGYIKENEIQVFEIIEVDAAGNYQSYYIYYLPFAGKLEVTFGYENYFNELGEAIDISSNLIRTHHSSTFTSNTSSENAVINLILESSGDNKLMLEQMKTANSYTKYSLVKNATNAVAKTGFISNEMSLVEIQNAIFTYISSTNQRKYSELNSNSSYTLTITDRYDNSDIVITINVISQNASFNSLISKENQGNSLDITANYKNYLYPSEVRVTYFTLADLTERPIYYDVSGKSLTDTSFRETTHYYLNKDVNNSTAVYFFYIADNFGRSRTIMLSQQDTGRLFYEVSGDNLEDKTSVEGAETTGKQIAFEFNLLFFNNNYSVSSEIAHVTSQSNGFITLLFDYKPFVNSTIEVILENRLGQYTSYFVKQNTDLPAPTFLDRFNENIEYNTNVFNNSLSTFSLINIILNSAGLENNPQADLLYWQANSSEDKAVRKVNIFNSTNTLTFKELGEYKLIIHNDVGAQMTFSFTIDAEESIFFSVKGSNGKTLKASVISAEYNGNNIVQYFSSDSNFKIFTSERKKIKVLNSAGSPISSYVATSSDYVEKIEDSYFFHLKSDESSSLDFETYIKVSVVASAPNPALKHNNVQVLNGISEIVSPSDVTLSYLTNLGNDTNGNYLTAYVYYKTFEPASLCAIVSPKMISASAFEEEIDLVFDEAGTYFVEFIDLAGNVVSFQTNNYFTVHNLSSVLGTVQSANKQNSLLDNIVLDNGATIYVDNFDKYSTFEYVLTKDGKEVSRGNYNSLSIADAGVYELTLNAKVGNTQVEGAKYKIFVINPNSARLGFEYRVATNYTISKVYQSVWGSNERSELGASNFEKNKLVLSQANNGNGLYNVKVDVNHNSKFKQNESFEFNLLIAYSTPIIESNMPLGETSTKKIELSFNPAQIYIEQGNCNLRIIERESGKIINEYKVNSNSAINEVQKIKLDEVGVYDIQVWSESGESLFYWTSITYQKPLNTVSIILIVIGIAAVITSIVLFIFLRTRMKVR